MSGTTAAFISTAPGQADESRAALAALADKYHPTGAPEDRDRSINRQFPALTVLRLTPVHITGKQARELMRKRETPKSP